MMSKIAATAVNGFHSESTDGSDDTSAITVSTRLPSDQMKVPANEAKPRKQRPELESLPGDGDVSFVANVTSRKPTSNDVSASGIFVRVVLHITKALKTYYAFSALMLLAGWQEGHLACKN